MILIISMFWIWMCLSLVGYVEDTAVGHTIKKDATKRQGYIFPHDLIRTWNFIFIMGFPGLIQRKVLSSWNINVLCHNVSVDCFVCLPSILYFTCWTRFVLVFFLFHWSPSCIIIFYCLNACDNSPVRNLSFTDHIHSFNRLPNMGMIRCKKNPHCLLNPLTSISNKILVLKEIFMLLP